MIPLNHPDSLEHHGISAGTKARGSYIKPIHTERPMTAYEVFDFEMDALSVMNWVTGLFFSAGSALISFAVGQKVDLVTRAIESGQPAAAEGLINTLATVCIVLAAVCYIVSGIAFWKRRSQLGKIRSESKIIDDG